MRYERLFSSGNKLVRASKVRNWAKVLETDPVQYAFIPKKSKTYEITKLAVSLYGWNIRWAPKQHQTEEVCDLAIIEDSESVVFMDNPACRHQVEAVHANPHVINFIQQPCDQAIKELKRRATDTIGRRFVLKKVDKKG